MIKIVTATTLPVGSTVALVELCNQFNARGLATTLYGPDVWHLDKCAAAAIDEFRPEKGDVIILNRINLVSLSELDNLPAKIAAAQKPNRFASLKDALLASAPLARKSEAFKLVLTCVGDDSCLSQATRFPLFDKIHLVHAVQRGRRSAPPSFTCPSFLRDLERSARKPEKVAGVLGSICASNRVDAAIESAFRDGMATVIVYGLMSDPVYYYRTIEPLTKGYPGRIKYAGFVTNRQKVYDSVSDVYCAVSKPGSPVQRECAATNTRFHGPDPADGGHPLSNDQIFEIWKKELEL